jgi:polysaccharide biosynthesis/export protein
MQFSRKGATSPFFCIIVTLQYTSYKYSNFREINMKMKQFFLIFITYVFAVGHSFAADNAYLLNPGDALQISVWGEDSLQKEVKVLPDGSISFPLAGRVEVANATTAEAEKRVTEKLKNFLPDPQVTVIVASIEGNRAYVIGKVLKPGPILLTAPVTVMQALSLAGGLDKFADQSGVKILRVDGTPTTIPVNYGKLLSGHQLESNVLLKTGDTILVP